MVLTDYQRVSLQTVSHTLHTAQDRHLLRGCSINGLKISIRDEQVS